MKRPFLFLFLLTGSSLFFSFAESFFFPADVTGWIVKDSFGAYYFYNGCYAEPISKNAKNDLAAYAGKPVNLHVFKGEQPINPGNARFDSVAMTGIAKPDSILTYNLSLKLQLVPQTGNGDNLWLLFEVQNTGKTDRRFYPNQLTFIITKLAGQESRPRFSPEDDSSFIVQDRQFIGTFLGDEMGKQRYQSRSLEAGRVYEQQVSYKLGDGMYYVWAGYGDNNYDKAPCLMSKGTAFKVQGGRVEIVPAEK